MLMIRTSLLALTTLFFAAALVAEEPTVDLETTVLEIMHTAFCIGDYDTVESLFDKLSPTRKKNFLQDACKLAAGEMIPGRFFDCSLLDVIFQRRNRDLQKMMNDATVEERTTIQETFASNVTDDYLPKKIEQTQLLGRLTLSLFEPSAMAEHVAVSRHEKVYYVVFQSPTLGEEKERRYKFPFTGNENVLDVIANIGDLQPLASKRIWIARRVENSNSVAVRPVDWADITVHGKPDTNYQLLPGDRVFVVENGEKLSWVRHALEYVQVPWFDNVLVGLAASKANTHQLVKPVRMLTRGNEIEIVCVNDGDVPPQNADPLGTPIVSVNLPHLENREQINGTYTIGSDGYLTFGYGGRAYVDGLTVDECRDAIEFHFSKYKIVPQLPPFSPYQAPQAASERQAVQSGNAKNAL
jgi:hypothetical protein